MSDFRLFYAFTSGMVLACVFFVATSVFAGNEQPEINKKGAGILDLTEYQTRDGLLTTFRHGDVADPYFGLYSLELARRAGMDIRKTALGFIRWGLLNQQSDGRFGRYCRQDDGSWKYCGRADSDDATLARWLQLLVSQSDDRPLPSLWQFSFDRALKALMSLRMDNGIYSVYPHGTRGYTGYALFKDNVEVLNALNSLAQYFRRTGNETQARRFEQDAGALRNAMENAFGQDIFALKKLALNAEYDRPRFYPHAVAVPFAWMEGYGPRPSRADAIRWLALYDQDWKNMARTNYPWGLMALALMDAGMTERAVRWYEDNQHWRQKGEHWNILEETCARIIHYRLLSRNGGEQGWKK
ncbi:hypothetical protein JV07_09875 [Salmonella enterica]|uniref:hypothetical protein n=1 Tax=Escherichia fergusonii TaxID=564 RepID=UPI0012814707|nr:hypothetical protein [Escherichia fergusonii]EAW8382121.1 hypothetical protein [Salmonella enterica]ECI6759084.1 hypothetical protein [Salmonella enterica subsp. enterica serovar Mbandaka]EJC1536199.1 hypothetical protein [Salmonella enterica subsp. enterica serovar Montevideo]EAY4988075.1 hypothetical protein [Salmonella enterica]MBA8503774.1 hypothetical protein [Escherichia fergusonii]